MNDFSTLTDAFDELERRADAAPVRSGSTTPDHRGRPMLIAASAVAVLAVATTVGIVAAHSGSGSSGQPAGAPPSSSPTASASGSAPAASPSASVATTAAPSAPLNSPVPASTATPSRTPGAPAAPSTTKQVEARFTAVLHGLATFTVTQHSGPFIGGLLTSAGVTGGYDIQAFEDEPGATAVCEDPGSGTCSVHRLPDRSSLAYGSEPIEGGGILYRAYLVQPDGTTIIMHVSNESDPKGDSAVLGARPPLTIKQMTKIVTSDRW
jgi:hypothetical protein